MQTHWQETEWVSLLSEIRGVFHLIGIVFVQ
jgi:hypothetical protein